ncbi:raffinose/stachyose/melibiose transport system permease protein [Geomicrobium halophilum]|uniref:Raffinose/stachyose/melibiose transport system permease protein n=1 Tax=Geomicrobium halophilum TaxID=549000 RepID=A0A841PVS1_9BACL|nr:sugar ABC transporter permease [Geomicrobium halophilum]MBB6451316.1 raffinose/stachyose/melibiose transport system permease protein [Geomicrobium halophilum]
MNMSSNYAKEGDPVTKSYIKKNKRKKTRIILGFIIPALVIYMIFTIYPIIATLNYSLTDWSGVSGESDFVGIQNYINLLGDSTFWQALQNNLFLVLVSVFLQIPLGLLMALVLFTPIFGKQLLNIVFFLPYLMSTVAIGILWLFMYDPSSGPINQLTEFLGIGMFDWLGDPNLALMSVLFVLIWQFSPLYMILFKAAMVGIPDELYEAANIDGANGFKQFVHVTFPSLIPTIVTSSVLAVVGSLKAFDIFYIMTGGGPGTATEILGTYMYDQAFINFNMGYASTIAAAMFIISLIAVIIIQYLDYRRKKKGILI